MAHVEKTKCPSVSMSAIWCLVSLYLILNLGIQIDFVEQPIKRNSVGSGNMFHCWTPAFDYHFHHGFIVLKHVQHRSGLRKFDVRRHIINIEQFRTVVLGWSIGLILLSCPRHDAMSQVSLY